MSCRCGWNGEGEHLCHRCGTRPGSLRFLPSTLRFSLAGAQLKFLVRDTWGCDECWADFKTLLEKP